MRSRDGVKAGGCGQTSSCGQPRQLQSSNGPAAPTHLTAEDKRRRGPVRQSEYADLNLARCRADGGAQFVEILVLPICLIDTPDEGNFE